MLLPHRYICIVLFILSTIKGHSQSYYNYYDPFDVGRYSWYQELDPVMDMMAVSMDARQMSLGQAGVITPNGASWSAAFSNPALLIGQESFLGIHHTVLPWAQRSGEDDFRYSQWQLAGSFGRHAVGVNYRNFPRLDKAGGIDNWTPAGTGEYFERAYQLNYAFRVSESFSIGGALKSLRYSMGDSLSTPADESRGLVRAIATDIGVAYHKKYRLKHGFSIPMGFGASITNFGNRVKTRMDDFKSFLPTEIHLGGLSGIAFKWKDFVIQDVFTAHWSKFLIPSTPVYAGTGFNSLTLDENGNRIVAQGYDPDVNPFRAVVQSFYDHPDGGRGELYEITSRLGNEISLRYKHHFAIHYRNGFFLEPNKAFSSRIYSMGVGVEAYGFRIDGGTWNQSNWASNFTYRRPNVLGRSYYISLSYQYAFPRNKPKK